jgi:hypothetical protein
LYTSYRKSRSRPKRETFAPALLAAVEARNRFDKELYEFGKGMFNDLVSRLGVDLERESVGFRRVGATNPLRLAVDSGSVAWRAAASRLVSLV